MDVTDQIHVHQQFWQRTNGKGRSGERCSWKWKENRYLVETFEESFAIQLIKPHWEGLLYNILVIGDPDLNGEWLIKKGIVKKNPRDADTFRAADVYEKMECLKPQMDATVHEVQYSGKVQVGYGDIQDLKEFVSGIHVLLL